jgi:hypothetical protein
VTAAVVLSIAGLVAACSGAAASPSATATPPVATPSGAPSPSVEPSASPSVEPSPSPAAAELVLRVTSEGGFISPAAHLAQLPIVVVYADGRILTPAPVPAIDPGPLVPVESVRDVGAAGVTAIRAAIAAAGLDAGGGTNPGVGADAADTVFVVQAGGRTVTTRFPALGVGGPGGPGRSGQPGASANPQRAAALDLLARLTDTSDAWGGPATAPAAYVPSGYRIFVVPGTPLASDTGAPADAVAWPLAIPLASFGRPAVPDRGISGLRVGVVRLADAATLAPVLDAATAVTPFTSGGESFTLRVSPLLPDEAAG